MHSSDVSFMDILSGMYILNTEYIRSVKQLTLILFSIAIYTECLGGLVVSIVGHETSDHWLVCVCIKLAYV